MFEKSLSTARERGPFPESQSAACFPSFRAGVSEDSPPSRPQALNILSYGAALGQNFEHVLAKRIDHICSRAVNKEMIARKHSHFESAGCLFLPGSQAFNRHIFIFHSTISVDRTA